MERTFVMVKPDGVKRGLTGEIITRLERKGLRIVALKMLQVTAEMAARHYEEHMGKSFYEELVNHITSGPVVAMLVEGRSAVEVVRRLVGETDPAMARPGTIRGDLAIDIGQNVIHAADSIESAEREGRIYFGEQEIMGA
ncbi:MAG: nucleoside-diphosphate kinase [Clostridia bacterium]|nr:nucleoside-diphosphate kinase [Clostridia bacterium]